MNCKRHILILAGLLGLSLVVQVVVIRRATVTGLDAIRFVRAARAIDRNGLLASVRAQREQPLFPAWLYLVHEGLTFSRGELRSAWATSAQVAAAIPLVLTIVPLYLLLLRLVDTAAAIAGSLFFCLLPEVARLGADGISDSTHLLFFCVALWAMVEYLSVARVTGETRSRRPAAWLLLAGLATAVAALARAEVLVLAGAFALTLLVLQFLPGRKRAWSQLAVGCGAFVLGSAVVLGPYLAVLGCSTPQAALAGILGRYAPEEDSRQTALDPDWRLAGGERASFDAKEPSISIRRRGYLPGVVRFGRKLADAFGYWIGALAVFGALCLRPGRASAADRFMQIFFLLFSLAAIRFTAAEGYLAPRHLLALVVAGIASAGHGAVVLGSLLQRALRVRLPGRPMVCAVVLVSALACLPQTLIRVHFSRAGHRAAAEWLASPTALPGAVLDTQGWTGLYSARETYPFSEAAVALADPRLAYVVLERQECEYDSGRARTLRWLIETASCPVAEFPIPAKRADCQQPVVIYRWYPDHFSRHLAAEGDDRQPIKEHRHAGANRDVRR